MTYPFKAMPKNTHYPKMVRLIVLFVFIVVLFCLHIILVSSKGALQPDVERETTSASPLTYLKSPGAPNQRPIEYWAPSLNGCTYPESKLLSNLQLLSNS
jgi:hypothetical protein